MRLGLVQVPLALDGNNCGKIFWMCASAHMAIYAIVITKFEINGNLVALEPGSPNLFGENYVIMNYEVKQNSIHSLTFMVHYYLEQDVDVA